MKTIFSLCIILTSQLSNVSAQNHTFEWAINLGSTGADRGYSITTDALGNVYSTGFFSGTVDFDPGMGVQNMTSAGEEDIFIQKLDASGNFLWAKRMGGSFGDVSCYVAIDNNNNVFTTGLFEDTVDFDPGPGTQQLVSLGASDVFIQKLDPSGNFLWVKQIGSGLDDHGSSITIDASGNIYSTGFFQNTADFDIGIGTQYLTSNGSYDIYIHKMTNAGDFLWVKQMGGASLDLPYSIAVDTSGNVYSTGFFALTADFDPGVGTLNLTSAGGNDIYIQKLDSSGNLLWVDQFGGFGTDKGFSLATDTIGNVYLAGIYTDSVDFDPGAGNYDLFSNGSADLFIQKITSSGDLVWAKSIGGNDWDQVNSITLDSYGNIYSTGYFNDQVDFDPGISTQYLTSNGSFDVFIQKLDTAGNFLWAKKMGGSSVDIGYAITTDEIGNIYAVGGFNAAVDFDPGVGSEVLSSNGIDDVFIQKLSECGINTGINILTQLNDPTITASSPTGLFQWLDCNNNYIPILGENNQNYTAIMNGSYAVEISENGCVDTSDCVTISTIDIFEITSAFNYSIYPNPTSRNIQLVFDDSQNFTEIRLYSITGRLLFFNNAINSNMIEIEINEASGVYYLEVHNINGGKFIEKIIKA